MRLCLPRPARYDSSLVNFGFYISVHGRREKRNAGGRRPASGRVSVSHVPKKRTQPLRPPKMKQRFRAVYNTTPAHRSPICSAFLPPPLPAGAELRVAVPDRWALSRTQVACAPRHPSTAAFASAAAAAAAAPSYKTGAGMCPLEHRRSSASAFASCTTRAATNSSASDDMPARIS